ncbi:MAG: restriction endonuclease subunit S [Syntrophus sp. (in: bacteria)]|nr:restriction endonuclease subunit S [Syntrophus sp. (in: bacteria)]
MSEWKEESLKKVVDIRVSNVDKKIHPNKSLVKLCNYMDAYSNNYITSQIPFTIGSADVNEIQRFGLKIDDVIITKDSETPEDIAVSSVVMEELDNVVCGYHLAILRPDKNELYGNFLMLKLKEPELKHYFCSVANGSTRYGLTIGNIEKAKIKYPSLSEQRQISRIVRTCDAVIEKTQAAIGKYKAIKQGMLHDLFTRGIDIYTGKLRPKYEDAPELYKDSSLGFIPVEWDIEMIGDVSSLVTNGFVGVATPYYTTADKGVPYLFGTNIREDSIDFNDLRYISREFNDSHVKSQLKPGDMLCVQSGHIGTSAVVPDNFVEANCHALIITRFYKEMIYPAYISFYLNSSIGKHQLDKIIIGSTIKHINTSDLAKHLIPKPPVEEQIVISQRLTIIDQKLQNEQTYLHKLQMLKAGLMADLLSGKKRVSLPEGAITQTEN